MPDPFIAEELKFTEHDVAQAQFWTAGPQNKDPGLRITIPGRGYEFSNDAYIGRDPTGIFSYNSLEDINNCIGHQTKFEVTTRGTGTNTYVTVLFYKRGNPQARFGRFVGRDRGQVAKASGFVPEDEHGAVTVVAGTGRWTRPGFGSTTAKFHKDEGSRMARITGDASPLVVEFELSGDDIVEKEFEVEGTLRYHIESLVTEGVYMRWNSDHFVFFRDDVMNHASDYTAYFMAFDEAKLIELMPAEHQNVTMPAKWLAHS